MLIVIFFTLVWVHTLVELRRANRAIDALLGVVNLQAQEIDKLKSHTQSLARKLFSDPFIKVTQ